MEKKLFIKTWGCKMNEYDSSKIINLLKLFNNYTLTKYPEEADILLLNTCSIRDKAQEKVFHQLGRWKKLKKNNSKLIIGVGGCVASQEGYYIYNRANYVDIIFGPQTLHRLPKMIEYVLNTKEKIIDVSFPKLEKFDFYFTEKVNKPISYISIMEGCNKFCSFCVVPYTRGKEISRSCDSILCEIAKLADNGVREINLLGQNVNSYCSYRDDGSICKFSELLRLVSNIDGIGRIRFITSHPVDFTDDIIDVYRDIPKLASFLHLPLQSGSDKILKMMHRSYTVLEYKEIINKLRKVRPGIHVSSDFIVAFPGENKEDFQKTIDVISEIDFDMSFSFIYSPRPGTPAGSMNNTITNKEKKKRLYILQNRIEQQAMKFSRRMKGTIQSVLVEGISKKNPRRFFGRTENNRVVNFRGTLSMIGKFVDIEIIDVHHRSLNGNVVSINM
ncbi:MAG: isopentenyl-adenosine A37 tRNA methylthiolase [Candidatus Westeberhardia cardiocondylae]|nr:isopentenyl-adenosine A37 tRNA methylthiolase [Candidatus Westeberhardia cardiocondylae]